MGPGTFMAHAVRRTGASLTDDAKEQYPQLWEKTFKRAAAEVYD